MDPYQVSIDQLKEIKVLKTYINNQCVYAYDTDKEGE